MFAIFCDEFAGHLQRLMASSLGCLWLSCTCWQEVCACGRLLMCACFYLSHACTLRECHRSSLRPIKTPLPDGCATCASAGAGPDARLLEDTSCQDLRCAKSSCSLGKQEKAAVDCAGLPASPDENDVLPPTHTHTTITTTCYAAPAAQGRRWRSGTRPTCPWAAASWCATPTRTRSSCWCRCCSRQVSRVGSVVLMCLPPKVCSTPSS